MYAPFVFVCEKEDDATAADGLPLLEAVGLNPSNERLATAVTPPTQTDHMKTHSTELWNPHEMN
jgi:hypothetical protein